MPDSDDRKKSDKKEEEHVRRRAYHIWEREGRPHGRHEHHWHMAQEEAARETRSGTDTQAVPAAQVGSALSGTAAAPPEAEDEDAAERRAPLEERSSGSEADPLGLVQGESAGFGAGISDHMVENTTAPFPATAEPQAPTPPATTRAKRPRKPAAKPRSSGKSNRPR